MQHFIGNDPPFPKFGENFLIENCESKLDKKTPKKNLFRGFKLSYVAEVSPKKMYDFREMLFREIGEVVPYHFHITNSRNFREIIGKFRDIRSSIFSENRLCFQGILLKENYEKTWQPILLLQNAPEKHIEREKFSVILFSALLQGHV